MLINASNAEQTVTTMIATTGIVVRLSIYSGLVSPTLTFRETLLTTLRAREKGSPRSRAKDQVMRDAAAKQPIALQNSRKMMMLTMIVAPAFDPTAARKIRMKAAVGAAASSISAVRFSALKRMARSMPIASVPLMIRLSSMDRGTSTLAFFTSSDIC